MTFGQIISPSSRGIHNQSLHLLHLALVLCLHPLPPASLVPCGQVEWQPILHVTAQKDLDHCRYNYISVIPIKQVLWLAGDHNIKIVHFCPSQHVFGWVRDCNTIQYNNFKQYNKLWCLSQQGLVHFCPSQQVFGWVRDHNTHDFQTI